MVNDFFDMYGFIYTEGVGGAKKLSSLYAIAFKFDGNDTRLVSQLQL